MKPGHLSHALRAWSTMLERREVINESLVEFESSQQDLNDEDPKVLEMEELLQFLEKESSEEDDIFIIGEDEFNEHDETLEFEEYENETAYTQWEDSTMNILLMYRQELRCQIATLQLNKFLKYGPGPSIASRRISDKSLVQASSATPLNE